MNISKLTIVILLFITNSQAYNASVIANNLGMRLKDYNADMAFTGILIGFIFMFFTIYLTVQIGGKK